MIPRKLLEAAFSRVWLLVLPIVLTPLLAVAMTSSVPQFQSSAAVWVSQPANISPTSFSQAANPYQTPADIQVQAMKDLLATKSFRSAVAVQAGFQATDTDLIARAVAVQSTGTNLISIVATRPDAASAKAIVSAVIAQYQQRATDESQRESTIAVKYYNTQIDLAQAELDARRTSLTTYVAANPKLPEPKTVDPTYARLSSAVDSQSKVVDGLYSSVQDAQRKAATASDSLAATFSVQDAASTPTAAVPLSITKRIGYPFAALIFGILISGTYVYIRYRTDHAIRSREDLIDLPVPVLGAIPVLPSPNRRMARPWTWLTGARRDYARAVAASISVVPVRGESS